MSTVAWRLLRDTKVRTTNRAEALMALLHATTKATPKTEADGAVTQVAVAEVPPPSTATVQSEVANEPETAPEPMAPREPMALPEPKMLPEPKVLTERKELPEPKTVL